jgi:hypothetical protein
MSRILSQPITLPITSSVPSSVGINTDNLSNVNPSITWNAVTIRSSSMAQPVPTADSGVTILTIEGLTVRYRSLSDTSGGGGVAMGCGVGRGIRVAVGCGVGRGIRVGVGCGVGTDCGVGTIAGVGEGTAVAVGTAVATPDIAVAIFAVTVPWISSSDGPPQREGAA